MFRISARRTLIMLALSIGVVGGVFAKEASREGKTVSSPDQLSKEKAKTMNSLEVKGRYPGFPAQTTVAFGDNVIVAFAFPTNNLGHRDNQKFPAYVVSEHAQATDGWIPCANRLHLTQPNKAHFIQDPGEAQEHGGLWVAHNFDLPTKSQEVWIWNANSDSMGSAGDIRWTYKLATGYFKKASPGPATNKRIIACKKATTKVALGMDLIGQPGELVGPPGDDSKPILH